MVAAITEGLGTVVEALADKGASVHQKSSYLVSELVEGDVSRTRVLTYVVLCCS